MTLSPLRAHANQASAWIRTTKPADWPALVVAGDHDIIRTEHTLALAQAIPGAELAILPNAGHGVVLEDAPRFNAFHATRAFTDAETPRPCTPTYSSSPP